MLHDNPEKWLAQACGNKWRLAFMIFFHILIYCMGVVLLFIYMSIAKFMAKEVTLWSCEYTWIFLCIGVIFPVGYLYTSYRILSKKKKMNVEISNRKVDTAIQGCCPLSL